MSMSVLEASITNIALPSISASLSILPAQAVWIVNAYQLAVVVSLLPCASLGEIYGYKRVFMCGLVGFTLTSAACALSGSFHALILFRLLQGFSAAGVMSVVPALLRYIYSQKQFGRAIGFNALVVALSSATGPMLGSLILSVSSWPWLFAVNVPIAAVALIIGLRTLPTTDRAKRRFDWFSAALSGTFFGLLIFGVDHLMTDTRTAVACLVFSALAATALVRRELQNPTPLLPLDLLRIRPFSYSICASVCAFSAQTMAFIALPFYFHGVMAREQLVMGMLMVPWPVGVAIAAPISARLVEAISPSWLCSIGTGCVALGLCIVLCLPADVSNGVIMSCMVLCGVGFGMFQTPNNRVMLTSAPRARSGGAGGLQATARQFGMAWGAAVVALAFTALPTHGSAGALVAGAAFMIASSCVSMARGGQRLPQHGPNPDSVPQVRPDNAQGSSSSARSGT
jgi:DHA2 family multidrug resistance protein-like MFS transporter